MTNGDPSHFLANRDASTVSRNWDAWLEEFEAFPDSKGSIELESEAEPNQANNSNMRAQRKVFLLDHANLIAREFHSTLAQTGRYQYA